MIDLKALFESVVRLATMAAQHERPTVIEVNGSTLVRNHEGEVSCEPGSLGGPCFKLVLPVAPPTQAFQRKRLNSDLPRAKAARAGSKAVAEEGENDGDDPDRR